MIWWTTLILYLSVVSAGPAIWLGRKQRGLLWYYAWASFITDIIPLLTHGLFGTVSYVQGNLFAICELAFVGLFFMREMPSQVIRRIVALFTISLALFFLIRSWPHINEAVNWKDVVFNSIFLMLLCIAALVKVMRNAEHLRIEQSPLFIISASFLLYLSYSVLLMLFTDQFMNAPKVLRQQLWSIQNLLNVLKNLAIARAFVMRR
jgi:hypothetical protein